MTRNPTSFSSLFGLRLLALSALLASPAVQSAPADVDNATEPVSFYKDILPILQANCTGCHQPAKAKGDYVMTEFAKLLAGGDEGGAVIPGDPDKSYLLQVSTPVDGEAEMPPKGDPLHQSQVALIRKWISEGAQDDTPESARVAYDMENPPVYVTPPAVTSIEYSPDGKHLAVAGYHEVLIHQADGSGIAARLVGLSERVQKLAWSPDGKQIAITGGSPARMGEIQVWDVAKQELKLSKSITFDTVYGASWSPDGSSIAFGCADNALRVINAKSGEETLFMGGHNDWVLDTVWSADGKHLVSCGRDMSVKLTEVATERFVDNITSITPGALKGGVQALASHPTRKEVLIGGTDGVPQIYRMERLTKRVIGDNANLIRKFPAMEGRIFGVAYSPDGKRIAAGASHEGKGRINLYSAEFDSSLSDAMKKVLETRVQSQNADQKKMVEDFVTKDVKQLASIEVPGGVYSVAFSPDGKTLAAAGQDGQIRLVGVSGGKEIKTFSSVPLVKERQLAAKEVIADDAVRPVTDDDLGKEYLHDGVKVASIVVEPKSVKITEANEYAQLLVTAKMDDGSTADITRMATISPVKSEVLRVDARGMVRPISDGKQTVTVRFENQTAKVPVEVSGMTKALKPDYVRDVMPVLSKLGCNMGTCHGAKDGKAGFKLSLRGYDPIFDVLAFADELSSRRANPAAPEHSLMLLKASGSVPHEGGQLTVPGELYYETLKAWISQGAKLDLSTPRVTSIEVFPKNPIIERVGARQQMRVVARYADGMVKDVTAEAYLDSGNIEVIEADKQGLMTSLRRGEAPVLARFEGSYAATTITVMGDRSGFVWQEPETWSRIDELVAAKWQRMKIQPSELSSDEAFLRRLHLDLTGLPPSPEAVREFLADKRPLRVKRDAAVDALIGNPDFVDHWSNKWADMLQVNSKFLGAEGTKILRGWIRENVEKNTPYDEFAHSIITASGSTKDNPAAAYYKITRDPEMLVENTTHLFLATRFNCNKCHDHPFEKWTLDQYYETAAFFAQIDLKRDPASGKKNIGGTAVEGAKPLYEIVSDKTEGDVMHLLTQQPVEPRVPYDTELVSKKAPSRRAQFADWMTSPENDYFAMSYANRIWGYLTGTGVIEPIDDIRAGNPPTNPELLQYLTNEFVQSGFDVRHLMRLIAKSRTYQLSLATNKWNEDDTINYSHAKARRLPAEVLFDSVFAVTGSMPNIPGVAKGTRAAQLADGQTKLQDGFLANFGKPARESVCECERSNDVNLGPIMALMSGPTVGDAISDPSNAIAELVKATPEDHQLIEEIFLRVLNRKPTGKEVNAALATMAGMDAEHQQLAAAWSAKEVEQKPHIANAEKARLDRIAKTKAELEAHRKKIAPEVAKKEAARKAAIDKAEKAVAAAADRAPALQPKWESYLDLTTEWVPLDVTVVRAGGVAKLEVQDDGSLLATPFLERDQKNGNYQLRAQTKLTGITGFKLEVLPDDRLPSNGPGTSPDGNFVLSEFKITQKPLDAKAQNPSPSVALTNPAADFTQKSFNLALALKANNRDKGWAVAGEQGYRHEATFQTAKATGFEGGTDFTFQLIQAYGNTGRYNIGRFRLWVTRSPQVRFGAPSDVVQALKVPTAQRKPEAKAVVLAHFLNQDRGYQGAKRSLVTARKPVPMDPQLIALEAKHEAAQKPIVLDPTLVQLRRDAELSKQQLANKRLTAAQDLTWALINSPGFLFNH